MSFFLLSARDVFPRVIFDLFHFKLVLVLFHETPKNWFRSNAYKINLILVRSTRRLVT